ncbi:MAG TPA: hydroxymethylbilane synthase [Candidatus Nanopelagicaceae bacterium]|nr:hydroxymethylbilane synthase [Candidatus Nanopelagicaceae bacterium]
MLDRSLRLGTRGSLLARTQSGLFSAAFASLSGAKIEEIIIRTEGDDVSTSLVKPARPGVFVTALRSALSRGEVDFIVHSFKDLPSMLEPGITLAAIPPREDPRDVLVSKAAVSLQDLPAGARVGTSSPRRTARIAFLRPDLVILPMRGNIDTRIGKVMSGEFDAAVLAAAGLNRVGRNDEIVEYLSLAQLVPAPAQGALAVECRSVDTELVMELSELDDPATRLCTSAERAVLVGIGATCATAIGAFATFKNGTITLTAELSDPATNEHHRVERRLETVNLDQHQLAEGLGLAVAVEIRSTPLGQRLSNKDV